MGVFSKIIDSIYFQTFYNVFLYLQSQYFLRFYLMIHFDRENGLKHLNKENIRFKNILKMHTDKLASWIDTNIPQRFEQNKFDSLKAEGNNINNIDLLKMKKISMDVFCRLIAMTNKYQNIDKHIHLLEVNAQLRKDEMLKISLEISKIKGSIDDCRQDLETIELISNKYFAPTLPLNIESNGDSSETNSEHLSSITKTGSQKCNFEDESQEYFGIYMCENSECESENTNGKYNLYSVDDDSDNIDLKVSQKCFAPVLKQLKSIINPIKTEMKERELKYFMSKGLDPEKIIKFNEDENDQISEHLMENPIHYQLKSSTDRYDENRSFLKEKQQIMLMPLNVLPSSSRFEDILE